MTEEYQTSYQLFLRALRRISWISGVGLAVSVLFLFYPDGRLFISMEGEGLNGYQTGRLICVGLASFGLLVAAVYRDFSGISRSGAPGNRLSSWIQPDGCLTGSRMNCWARRCSARWFRCWSC